MGSKSYKDLVVWQKAMDLVEDTYRLTTSFPRQEEFGLKAQMRRAAVSVPSNIAEGQGRHQHKVFRQFLTVAMGSLSELEMQFDLSVRLRFLTEAEREPVACICEEVGKMIYGFLRSLVHNTVDAMGRNMCSFFTWPWAHLRRWVLKWSWPRDLLTSPQDALWSEKLDYAV